MKTPFYTPVKIGDDTVGVRIAVRDLGTPMESQIYNWGIKKDTSVGGAQPVVSDSSRGTSLDVSNDIISEKNQAVKGTGAAEANFSGKAAYQDLLTNENTQRDRPDDVRPMEVPKVDNYGRNVSETVGNLYGAKITTDEMAGTIGRGELGLHVHR